MNKQQKTYVGILCGFPLVLVIWHFTSDVYNVSAVYRNDEYGFTLLYPQSWEIVDTEEAFRGGFGDRLDIDEDQRNPTAVFILSPDRGVTLRPSAMVSTYPLEPGEVIGQAMLDDFLSDIGATGTNFGMISQSVDTLAGHEAMHASYKLRIDWQATPYYVRYDSYLVPYHQQLYAITCTSTLLDYSRQEPIFRKILDSFAFVES